MAQRIKKNKYPKQVEAVLDLHGATLIEAEAEVIDWLIAVKAKHYRLVRIITGKGINSQDGPKLKPWLEQFLRVRHYQFTMAKMNEGGEGAVDIVLE